MGGTASSIDVMIITFNEALNLPHCLRALQGWTRRIFVIDSGSTDETKAIAESFGAVFIHHAWEGYARQKNWGLKNLPFEAEWVLIVDADEVITPKLREQLIEVANRPVGSVAENGFFINRLTYFLGRPIRHCGYFPSWNLRFFKKGMGLYEDREVHEHVVIDDPVGYMHEPMNHDDRRGLEHYVAKHNRYSTLEARSLFKEINSPKEMLSSANVSAVTKRRRWLKRHVLPRVPMPWLWRFLYMYIMRGGILDGRAGLEFCKFISIYDYLVAFKLRALRRQARTGQLDPELVTTARTALAVPEGADAVMTADLSRAEIKRPMATSMPSGALMEPRQPAALDGLVKRRPPGAPVTPEPAHGEAERLVDLVAPEEQPPGAWPAVRSVKVSVLIPVKNEQRNIVDCIRQVSWADEIVVVDSHSTDLTVPLAQAMGADVYQFDYSPEGWPKKKNWALENVPWRNEWVLILDADEHMTPELTQEVVDVVNGQYQSRVARKAGCGDGYWLNRRFMFMGRWIRGCGYYPSYNVRLLRHDKGRYERIGSLGDTNSGDNEVHEHIILNDGPAGYLEGDFLHFAYPDLTTWIEKHNRYSNWEAHAMAADNKGGLRPSLFGGPIERRRWIKQAVRRLPFRPTLRFIYSYILKRGFLDGYPGYVMSRLLAWYEFVSIAKYKEMRIREKQMRKHGAEIAQRQKRLEARLKERGVASKQPTSPSAP